MVRLQTKERETPDTKEAARERQKEKQRDHSTEEAINTTGAGKTPRCQGQLRVFMAALTVNPLCISVKKIPLSIKKHHHSYSKSWIRAEA